MFTWPETHDHLDVHDMSQHIKTWYHTTWIYHVTWMYHIYHSTSNHNIDIKTQYHISHEYITSDPIHTHQYTSITPIYDITTQDPLPKTHITQIHFIHKHISSDSSLKHLTQSELSIHIYHSHIFHPTPYDLRRPRDPGPLLVWPKAGREATVTPAVTIISSLEP